MQKYELSRETLKMTKVLWLQLYKILLYIARIGYENTYDMHEAFAWILESDCMPILAKT